MIKAAMRFKNVRRVGQTRRFRTGHVMHNKMLLRAKQFNKQLVCCTLIPPLQFDLHGLRTLKLFLFLQSRSGSRSANGFLGFWPAATHKPSLSCCNIKYFLGLSRILTLICAFLYLLDYVFVYKTVDSIDFPCNISGRTAEYWE